MPVIYTDIQKVQLVKNTPVNVTLTSDKTSKKYLNAYFDIVFTGNPTALDTFTLTYGDNILTFTFQSSPDDSGTELSLAGALNQSDFVDQVRDEMMLHPIIRQYFSSTRFQNGGGNEVLTITTTDGGQQDTLTASESVANMTITTGHTQASNYEENLQLALFVEKQTQGTTVFEPPIVHHLPAIENFNKAVFDIHTDFDLKTHLPPNASLISGGANGGEATDCFQKFQMYFANRYGANASTRALTRAGGSELFVAIWGAKAWESRGMDFFSSFTQKAPFLTAQPTTKIVTQNQPEYLYFLPREAGITNYELKIKTIAKNGTETTTDNAFLSVYRGEVQWLRVGFDQLGLTQNATNPIVSWQAWIEAANVVQSDVRTFVLEDIQTNYERFFAFGNSMGGLDIVRAKGKFEQKTSVKYKEAMRPDAAVSAYTEYKREGSNFSYLKKQKMQFKGSIGYVEEATLAYLKDFIFADETWLIDQTNNEFRRINIDSKEADLGKDDSDLYQLNISFSFAWEDEGNTVI